MHCKLPTLLALVGASLAAADATDNKKSDVHELKKDTFDDFIKNNDLVLAEFFAPWCGHCKALAPEYEVAATELKKKDIHLAKIDCTEEADLCQAQGVEGYPTLKVFRGADNVAPYQGQRKSDAIVSYMIKQSLPAVSVLTSDAIEEFKTTDKVVMIAYFDAKDTESNKTFTKVAESLRNDFLFGATSDAALAKAAGVKQPGIVLYKTFDDPVTKYDGKFEDEAISSFIKTESVPLVGEVGPETYSGYMAAGIPLAYYFGETAEDREKHKADIKTLALKYKGKINFATIDAKAYGAHAGNLNLEQKWPAFAIQDTVKNQKFPYDQAKELSIKDIEKFVKDFADGKVEPSIKSEPIPEKQEGPVHVVVAHNYKDIVMDDDKDVLVEFYAPWCGHCKALAPKYDELGALYFNNPDYAKKVVIAKVDATANDVPDEIQGFPTIKLFVAGKKTEPVEYNGSRTVEDLAAFIKENGKHKVDAYAAKEESVDSTEGAETLGKAAPAATEKAEEAKEEEKPAAKKDAKKDAEKADEKHDEL